MKNAIVGIVVWTILLTSSEAAVIRTNSSQESSTAFLYDGFRNLISFINNTDCRAGAWSPNFNISSVFNGRNGSAVIYNHWNDSGVYIPRSLNLTWNSSHNPWLNYFSNLNLTQLFDLGRKNGTVFTMSNITAEILDELSNAVSSWGPRSTKQYQNSFRDPLNSYRNISVNVTQLFNGPLLGLLPTMGLQTIPLSYDIFSFIEVLQGLSTFFNNLRGGLPVLLNSNFTFDPLSVFNARNGIEALSSLLQTLQPSFDLNNLLSDSLNSVQNFLQLMTQLGGNVCRGVTGRLLAIFEQLEFGNRICTSNNSLGNVWSDPVEWIESVEALYNATQSLGSEFAELRNFINNLRRREASNGSLSLEIG